MHFSWALLVLALVAAPVRGAGPEINIGKTFVTRGTANKIMRHQHFKGYKCPYKSPVYHYYVNKEFVVSAYSEETLRYTIKFVESELECTVWTDRQAPFLPQYSALASTAGNDTASNIGETFITLLSLCAPPSAARRGTIRQCLSRFIG